MPTLPVGSKVFANNALSVVIPANPTLDVRSAAELATIDAGGSMGRFTIDATTYRTGTNLGVVSNTDPVYTPICDLTSYGTCTLSTVHIPNGYRDGKGSDFHSTWINQASGTDDEAWLTGSTCSGQNCAGSDVTFPIAGALHVGFGGRALLSGDGTNCNATGGNICLAAGTLRPVDLVNNSLNHGVMLAVQCLQATTYVYPATKSDGLGTTNCAGGTPPRYGQKLWLDPQGVAELLAINPVVLAPYIRSWNTYGAVLSDRDEGIVGVASGSDPMAVSIDTSSAWGTVISSIVSDPHTIAYANNVTSGAYHINLNMPADIQSRLHVLATCVNTNTCAIPSPSPSPLPSPSPSPSSSPSAAPSGTPTTVPAFRLYDSIGLNVHIDRSNEQTAQWNQLFTAMGIRHIRTPLLSPYDANYVNRLIGMINANSANGLDLMMLTNKGAGMNASLYAQYKNSLGSNWTTIEGINEPDNHASATAAQVRANQQGVWNAVHAAGSVLNGMKVVDSSILDCNSAGFVDGEFTNYADYATMHEYYPEFKPNELPGIGGKCTNSYGTSTQGQGSLEWGQFEAREWVQGKPVYTTEIGECNAPIHGCAAPVGTGPSTGTATATYEPEIPIMLFLYDNGATFQRAFLYEFGPDEDNTSTGGSLGLLDTAGNRRPAYFAVQGLVARLKDAANSTPRALNVVVSSGLTSTKHIPLSYADGSYGMVLVQDVNVWNPNAGTPAGCSGAGCSGIALNPPDDSVQVSIPGGSLSSLTVSTYNEANGMWADDTSQPLTLPIHVTLAAKHMTLLRWR